MEKIKRESFRLEKIKIKSESSLMIDYVINDPNDEVAPSKNFKMTCIGDINKDLRSAIDKLSSFLYNIYFNNNSIDQSRVSASGVVIKEQQIIITGTLKDLSDRKAALNSGIIYLDENPDEEELRNICQEIQDETYLLLFEGKNSQLSLFND